MCILREKVNDMKYEAQTYGKVGDVIGLTTGAGYYEGKIVEIRECLPTADMFTFCDYIMLETLPYFVNLVGEKTYHNCNMLAQLKVRQIGVSV
jgi:hypothetical protein